MSAQPQLAAGKLRVRMYRVGFGDCFLLSVPDGTDHAHILVDCGVHSQGDIKTMKQCVANIAEVTKKKLAVVIATHAHQDHISGFASCADAFKEFEIGEVWMPWLMNDGDRKANKLARKQMALADSLHKHFGAVGASREVEQILINATGASHLGATGGGGNAAALKLLRSGFDSGTVHYFTAGDNVEKAAGVKGLTAHVLAPSKNEEFLSKMDPPVAQRYRIASDDEELAGGIIPFAGYWQVKRYGMTKADEAKLQQAIEVPMSEFAFALDKVLNNTSLVVLFRFGDQALLFPGDAQWGNWQSWLDADGKELLSNVTFYKVAHHGSWNATPKPGLEGMTIKKFAAMASTQSKPWPSIPGPKLVDALRKRSGQQYIQSDSLPVKGAPFVRAKKPRAFAKGDLWYDYVV